MSRARDRVLARALLSTRAVDRAARRFDRLRSQLVVRWASSDVLAEFNAMAYSDDDAYRPGTKTFRRRLFPWEAAAIREHFPPAPGRVLVGGAGGGREAVALNDLGYEVVAFEPAASLAAAMAAEVAGRPDVHAFEGGYEDLPLLRPTGPPVVAGARASAEATTSVASLAPFAAAVMGWGSISHLGTADARVQALRSMAEFTDGPVLVSFLAFRDADQPPTLSSQRRLEHFSIFIGYYHAMTRPELEDLAMQAGLEVVACHTDETESSWPHAILRRAALDPEPRPAPRSSGDDDTS